MVDDGTVWRFGAERYVFVTGGEGDYDWIGQQAEPYEVEVTNLTSDWTTLAVQGPKSRDTVRKLTNVDLDALYSPTRERGVAMAYVAVAHAIAGAPIRVKAIQSDDN